MQEIGHDQVIEAAEEQGDFLTHLRNFGGEWFLEDIQTPAGTEWLVEAMKKRDTAIGDRQVVHGTPTPQYKRCRVDHPRQSDREKSSRIAGGMVSSGGELPR